MWLYWEIRKVREPFSAQIADIVARLNGATWPSDVGLSPEQFPFKIWRGGGRSTMHMDEELSLGEILQTGASESTPVSTPRDTSNHVFITRLMDESVEVQLSGNPKKVDMNPAALHRCRGAGVLIPGPLKKEQRCRDKITADYKGREPWPPAASLGDIVRCAVAFDDPYAMAVMIALVAKEFDVIRVKNRFENDEVEEVSADRMQAEFYAAETLGDDADSTNESAPKSEKMYRDVLVNLRPKGSDFICEVQITLTGISILKMSEQRVYSLARMTSPEELLDTYVFSENPEVKSRTQSLPLPSSQITVSAVEPLTPQNRSPGEENTAWAGVMPSPRSTPERKTTTSTRAEGHWLPGALEARLPLSPLSPNRNKRYETLDGTEDEMEPLSPLSVRSVK
jgi:hypothetical protein